MSLFSQNIQTKGRIIRGLGGLALLVGGILLWSVHIIPSLLLLLSAGFVLFEALRGWCALRACGIKTKF